MKDFVPWVHPESNQPPYLEEEEEEEEMTRLLDRYAARKRKRQEDFERELDQAEGSSRHIKMGIRRCRRLSFRARLRWGKLTNRVRRMLL